MASVVHKLYCLATDTVYLWYICCTSGRGMVKPLHPRRIANLLGSELMKFRGLPCHCCSGGTVESIRRWRLGFGLYRVPSQLSNFKMSPTGMWTPSALVMVWSFGSSVVPCDYCHLNPHIQCMFGPSSSTFLCLETKRSYKSHTPGGHWYVFERVPYC